MLHYFMCMLLTVQFAHRDLRFCACDNLVTQILGKEKHG